MKYQSQVVKPKIHRSLKPVRSNLDVRSSLTQAENESNQAIHCPCSAGSLLKPSFRWSSQTTQSTEWTRRRRRYLPWSNPQEISRISRWWKQRRWSRTRFLENHRSPIWIESSRIKKLWWDVLGIFTTHAIVPAMKMKQLVVCLQVIDTFSCFFTYTDIVCHETFCNLSCILIWVFVCVFEILSHSITRENVIVWIIYHDVPRNTMISFCPTFFHPCFLFHFHSSHLIFVIILPSTLWSSSFLVAFCSRLVKRKKEEWLILMRFTFY